MRASSNRPRPQVKASVHVTARTTSTAPQAPRRQGNQQSPGLNRGRRCGDRTPTEDQARAAAAAGIEECQPTPTRANSWATFHSSIARRPLTQQLNGHGLAKGNSARDDDQRARRAAICCWRCDSWTEHGDTQQNVRTLHTVKASLKQLAPEIEVFPTADMGVTLAFSMRYDEPRPWHPQHFPPKNARAAS